MIVSNEPGYYEDGAFGIRIENLLVRVHACMGPVAVQGRLFMHAGIARVCCTQGCPGLVRALLLHSKSFHFVWYCASHPHLQRQPL